MIKMDFNPPAAQLRQFGWIALVGFPLIGWLFTYKFGWLPVDPAFWIFLGLGIAMALAAAAKLDAVIKPVFIVLMLIALPIGMVISFVLLALIYFGLFTPVGLLFRATGRDLLHRKPDPAAESYWTVRETQRTPASYLRLY